MSLLLKYNVVLCNEIEFGKRKSKNLLPVYVPFAQPALNTSKNFEHILCFLCGVLRYVCRLGRVGRMCRVYLVNKRGEEVFIAHNPETKKKQNRITSIYSGIRINSHLGCSCVRGTGSAD